MKVYIVPAHVLHMMGFIGFDYGVLVIGFVGYCGRVFDGRYARVVGIDLPAHEGAY